jgi:hypothetical protein
MTTHHTYVAILVFLTALATAFVAVRFVAKHITKVNFTKDDALLVAALVSAFQGSLYPEPLKDSHAAAAHVCALRWSNLGYVMPVLSEDGILIQPARKQLR